MASNYKDIETAKDDSEEILKESRKPHLRQIVGRHKTWKRGLEKNLDKQKKRGFQW